jgi:hypothetical protein
LFEKQERRNAGGVLPNTHRLFHFLFLHFAGNAFGGYRSRLQALKGDLLAAGFTNTVRALFDGFQGCLDFTDEPALSVPNSEQAALIFVIGGSIQRIAHGGFLRANPYDGHFAMGEEFPELVAKHILQIIYLLFLHQACAPGARRMGRIAGVDVVLWPPWLRFQRGMRPSLLLIQKEQSSCHHQGDDDD